MEGKKITKDFTTKAWRLLSVLLVIDAILNFIISGCAAIVPIEAVPTSQAVTVEAVPTEKPTSGSCAVRTGIDGGTVNLRGCAGTTCGAVVGILTEGEAVTVITSGEYYNVATESGAAGWLAEKYLYCGGLK